MGIPGGIGACRDCDRREELNAGFSWGAFFAVGAAMAGTTVFGVGSLLTLVGIVVAFGVGALVGIRHERRGGHRPPSDVSEKH